MARKDVSLVINAKDKASGALDRISASLEEFRKDSSEVEGQSGKTASALGKIGKAVSEIEKAFNGLDGAGKLRAELDEATAAVARLAAEGIDARKELADYEKRLKEAEKAVASYDKQVEKSVASQAKQKKALKDAERAVKAATKAQEDAAKAQAKLQARQAELPAAIAKQEAALAKASARFADLSAKMAATDKVSKSLQGQFDSSTRAVAKAEADLKGLRDEYAGLGAAVKKSTKELASASGGVSKANANVDKARAKVESLVQAHAKLTESARKAKVEERALEKALAAAASSADRSKAGFEKAKAALDELRVKSAATEAALKELTGLAFGKLGDQIVKQGLAFRKSREDVNKLTQEVRDYKAVIAQAGVPTREMAQNLAKLEAAANEAELKMLRQEEALQRMAAAYRKNGASIEGVAKSQRAFSAEQERLAADLRELTEDGYKARRAIDDLNKAQAKSAADKMARDIARLAAEANKAKPKISQLRQEYEKLTGGSRQSLSITQRLRGEVLSMIAAYGGLYGVINLLRQTVDAMQLLEAATARLNVANEGNFDQTADDLEYLRFQADRLGINLGTLSTEFSKFSIATQGTNLAGQRTRDIFQSVAEAARVARISNEQLSGIFTALTQIVSKGAVQMEELRQQLGDRLPGALQIMADGLGLTTAELIKMMEQGQITSDALLPFADELTRRFGPGLVEALGSTSAELGRLQNAAFNALVAFGEAGFIESFTDLVRDLIELLKSPEFATFSERMSAAFSTLNNLAGFAARNFQLVATVIGAAIGLKSTALILRMVAAVKAFSVSLAIVPGRASRTAAALNRMGIGANTLRGRLILLQRSIQGLMSSTGIGLLFLIGGGIFANWITSASSVNDLMSRHEEIMGRVTNAYAGAEGAVDRWRQSLEDVTAIELRADISKFEDELDFALFDVNNLINTMRALPDEDVIPAAFIDRLESMTQAFVDGTTDAEDYKKSVADLTESYLDAYPALGLFAEELVAAAGAATPLRTSLRNTELLLIGLTGTTEEAEAAMAELANRGRDTAAELEPIRESGDAAAEALERMDEAVDDLTGSVRDILKELPGMEEYFDRLEESEAMEKLRADAFEAAKQILDVGLAWDELTGAVEGFSWDGILDIFKGDLSEIYGLVNGISGAFQGLFDRAGNLGGVLSDAVGGFGSFLGNLTGANIDIANDAGLEDITNRIIYRELAADPNARATTSSATGLGQFISETWVTMFRQNFPEQAATMGREAILALRTDPQLNYTMTRLAVQGYAENLSGQGLPVNGASIYAQHFLGQEGGNRLLRADPNASFASTFPAAAASNPTFANMTNGELLARFDEMIRGVTDDQVARAQQYNPDPAGPEAPEVPEFQQRAEETQDQIDQGAEDLEVQRLINDGLEREAAILEARNDALRDNPTIDPAQLQQIEDQAAAQFDLAAAAEARSEAESEADRIAQEAAAQRESTSDTLNDAEFDIRQQELMNQGLERQARIEAAIREAKANDPNITQQEIALLTARTSALYDAERAGAGVTDELEAAEEAQERINELTEKRAALQELLEATIENGDTERAMELRAEIEGVNAELLTAIGSAEELWRAVGGTAAETAIAQLGTARIETQNFGQDADAAYLKWDTLGGLFVDGLAGAFDQFAQAVANGEDKFESARDAFLQFAGQFLIQIAQMILKQLIFNALQGAFGGTSFGSLIGIPAATGHTGGMVGSKRVGGGNRVKTVNPGIFAGAQRYHGGGMIGGLSPGEVPIIAKEGEYMADENDPLHPNNQTGKQSSGSNTDMTIYNLIDGEQVMRAALAADKGGNLLLNHIRANKDSFRAILNG